MAAYNLTQYIIKSNLTWFRYPISGGFVPLAVFSVPLSYDSSDSYDLNATFHDLPGFNLPSCAQVFQDTPVGGGTSTFVTKYYYNTTDSYFFFGKDNVSDRSLSIRIHDKNKHDGTFIVNTGAGFNSPNRVRASGVGFTFIRFTNNVALLCGYISYNVDPGTYGDIISDLTDSRKGELELKNSYYVNIYANNLYFNQNYIAHRQTYEEILSLSDEYDPNNPYDGGDRSSDPGNGEFDYGGDEIDIPDEPTVSVADSGFVSLFAPSESQLNALAKFMWSDTFSLASFKKLFNNPMDCILGLSIVPVNLPTGTAKEITVGNIVSTVKCNVCTKQFVTVNCGSLTISPTQFTGGYLDYSPYTKCYIYLPFIGIQQLNIDDVMNSTVNVVYHVDILTGACVCYLKMTNRTTGGRSQPNAVLYTFSGQCAESVPLSSTSFSQTMGSILTAAGAIGGAVATIASGGAAAPVAGALTTAATSTANAATSMKPNIQHSGSLGGSSGFMNIRYPFMIFDCPHTAIPQKQYEYTGFPSNAIVKLSELSGFNIVQAINLSVKGALDTECDMIKSALESGVIF